MPTTPRAAPVPERFLGTSLQQHQNPLLVQFSPSPCKAQITAASPSNNPIATPQSQAPPDLPKQFLSSWHFLCHASILLCPTSPSFWDVFLKVGAPFCVHPPQNLNFPNNLRGQTQRPEPCKGVKHPKTDLTEHQAMVPTSATSRAAIIPPSPFSSNFG